MEYQPGALLCNLFLADELNRATSRMQSALLEAMEEELVTVAAMSKAAVYVQGRDYVLSQNVKEIFRNTVAHRLLLTGRGVSEGADPIADALGSVKPSKLPE